MATQLGFEPSAHGLLVTSVDDDSPLSSEIQLYDLIEEVARTRIESLSDLQRVLDASPSRNTFVLKIRRQTDGTERTHLAVWRR